MSTNIRLYGTKQTTAATDESTSDFFKLEEAWELNPTRAAGEKIETVTIEDNQYVEIVFGDGTTWFGDSNNLKEIFPELKAQSRSADDAPILPGSLASDDASRSLIGDIALKLLRKFVKKQVKETIKSIAEKIEARGLKDTSGKVSEGLFSIA